MTAPKRTRKSAPKRTRTGGGMTSRKEAATDPIPAGAMASRKEAAAGDSYRGNTGAMTSFREAAFT